jgi:SAM-dependent methyltransferase
MKPGSVLDIGAAAGFILKGFESMGWIGKGVEPNPRMAEYARSCLGLDVETSTMEELGPSSRYDLISMIQVVAHFVDPREVLEIAVRRTKAGGFWLFETWNRESLLAKLSREFWHEYNPPSVLHWFTPRGLSRLVEGFGLREVAHGRPDKWIRASHAKAIVRNASVCSPMGSLVTRLASVLPDRLPLPYLGDDVFWALYRTPHTEVLH